MLILHTLLLEASLPLLFTSVVATGCYMSNGSASIDEQWPCNPSAEASICCGVLDYCLGSAMCIDTGADNKFSIQGCTDSSWPGACNPICPGMTSDWYISIQICSSKDGSSKVCCGPDYTCCGEAGLYDLPVFTAISKPPGLARATSLGASSTSSVAATTTAQESIQTGTGATTAGDDGRTRNISIGLGVGLGVPLVLALLATGFLMFRARQKKKIKPKDDSRQTDVSSQLNPPMVRPGNDQMEDVYSPQDQTPLQQSRITELPGRGRGVSCRSAQELSGH